MSRRTVRPRANDARSCVASLEQRIAELEQQQRTAELVTDALTTDDDLDIRFQVTTGARRTHAGAGRPPRPTSDAIRRDAMTWRGHAA